MERPRKIETYSTQESVLQQLQGRSLFENTQYVHLLRRIGGSKQGSKQNSVLVRKNGSRHGSTFKTMAKVQKRNNSRK